MNISSVSDDGDKSSVFRWVECNFFLVIPRTDFEFLIADVPRFLGIDRIGLGFRVTSTVARNDFYHLKEMIHFHLLK